MKLATYLLALVLFAGFFLLQPSSAQTNSTTTTNTTSTTEASTTEASTTTTTATSAAKTANRKHFTITNMKYKVVRKIKTKKNVTG
ncbi:uncharacterized protein LOC119553920 [Drosophila subpulchrella]|uniref:uncharacterized protein LOC119553920 n=1 Tax=Drosophila subpulchrella TaxID=1486046 RepID=UPI0018A141C1|nr:uncharacterized protein LOC119553920 [Drosophila subpulchrella]